MVARHVRYAERIAKGCMGVAKGCMGALAPGPRRPRCPEGVTRGAGRTGISGAGVDLCGAQKGDRGDQVGMGA